MISSVGQSPTEPWFSDGGKRSRSDRATARPASCHRPRFGVRPRVPDRADHHPTRLISEKGPGVWGQRPQNPHHNPIPSTNP